MLRKVLIANRGEIACRVIRACRDMGIESVAVYSEADVHAAFVALADEAYCIGPTLPSESYLNVDAIMKVAIEAGVDAVHPGYGFLSENRTFSAACEKAGIVFVGPGAKAIAAMGDKVSSRELMQKAGVPVVPGSGVLKTAIDAVAAAQKVGYPVLLKASAGGGGIGMHIAHSNEELAGVFDTAQSQALRSFGNAAVFIERYVEEPRHIEIQVIADTYGNTCYVGERECSIQRRHQKIVEETPSTVITSKLRLAMGTAAVKAAESVGYVNAGTVEFIFSKGDFFFLEMNTRLQVEHPITEAVTGIDLVVEQLRIASGEKLSFTQQDIVFRGHAIECRVNAEDYVRDFMPSPGPIRGYHEPAGPGVRVDSGIAGTGEVSAMYDPMIAKLIVWGATREQAIQRMHRALYEYVITGVSTNIPYHAAIMESPTFQSGTYSTHFIEEHPELVERGKAWDDERQVEGLIRNNRKVAAIAAAVAITGA